MEWLKNNILSIIIILILAVVLYNQKQTREELEDVRNEAAGTNSKLDYVESDINSPGTR